MEQDAIEANIIGPVLHLLQHAEFETKKEAAVTAFTIFFCNNQLLEWIENELIWVLGFVPGLSSVLPNLISKLHAAKEKCIAPRAPVSSSDEVQKWWNLSITSVWNTVVWLMLLNFFI
ncbi:hypothetical protein C5167_008159 [Papaver somniferum]|uniref:Uncharacterized protein n=1 Tax=Papaver somniferum TaxID=3469 RepID=A0A4Y7JWN0_PAPSO|nr:hypothetical protein C5167_008159 [Papaver somniferum]